MRLTLTLLNDILLAPLVLLHAADNPVVPPSFNWERVPLYVHFGQRTGDLTDE